MTSKADLIKTLLIEDNGGDVALVRTYLSDAEGGPYEVIDADTLSRALAQPRLDEFSAILLDLNLPDSAGLRTFETLRSFVSEVPIIVLSGLDDLGIAKQAVQRGAQDYLIKDQITTELLARSIHYAIERFRNVRQLQAARAREEAERLRLAREVERLAAYAVGPPSAAASVALGLRPLAEALPADFDRLVRDYLHFVFESMERQMTERDPAEARDLARQIAEQLGRLRAGPRDVLDLHMAALRREEGDGNVARRAAFYHEGRFAVLEVMSQLVSYYRNSYSYSATRTDQGERSSGGSAGSEQGASTSAGRGPL